MLAVFIIYGIYHLYVCTVKLSILGVQKSSVRLKLQMLRTRLLSVVYCKSFVA